MQNDRSWTEINLTNFEHNLKELRKFLSPGIEIMQIVKADAYGHGAFQIAERAVKCGVTFLGVANVDEGMLLRYQGIEIPILILSPSLENEIERIIGSGLTPSVSTVDFAEKLGKYAKSKDIRIKIHINIDTGMGRSGIYAKEAIEIIKKIRNLENLEIEGIFSHYSASENDQKYTQDQLKKFKQILSQLDFSPEYTHISNSSAVITSKDDFSNLVRIGLLSYGVYSDKSLEEKVNLKPVMTFKSRISQIKIADKGESIGYNRTYIASQKIKYAILPVGYADGYDFMLSNKGKVLIKEKICKIVGKVSMDMIAVDVSNLKKIDVNDKVILLGDENSNLRAENLTGLFNGSSYEILCQVGRRAKRYYKDNGKIIDSSPLLRRDFVSTDYSDEKLNFIIETAIEQRLQSKEIANLIYSDVLKRFFAERDKEICYRNNFVHTIEFKETKSAFLKDYFLVNTTLTFNKKLQNDYFYVACAKNENLLEKYFLRKDVEYRWILDNNFDLETEFFDITSVKINEIELYNDIKISGGCIEIRCYHQKLKELVGKEVNFSISTRTYYPQSSHQLSVYIIEMTQGVNIEFIFNKLLPKVEAVPIFSGRNKFPQIENKKDRISISSQKDEWIFPNSGVVFVY